VPSHAARAAINFIQGAYQQVARCDRGCSKAHRGAVMNMLWGYCGVFSARTLGLHVGEISRTAAGLVIRGQWRRFSVGSDPDEKRKTSLNDSP